MRKFSPLTLLVLVCLIALSAFAALPAFNITNLKGQKLADGPFTLGWEFTPNNFLSVTQLGVFDGERNGLLESHDVGIWDSAGNLVCFATVAAGTVDPLYNQFRYANATGFGSLLPGQTYEIGAVWNNNLDDLVFPGSAINFATNVNLTFDKNSFIAGGTLTDPTNHLNSEPGYFGPNFRFSTEGTPEPSSFLLLGSGLLGVVGVIRCKMNL